MIQALSVAWKSKQVSQQEQQGNPQVLYLGWETICTSRLSERLLAVAPDSATWTKPLFSSLSFSSTREKQPDPGTGPLALLLSTNFLGWGVRLQDPCCLLLLAEFAGGSAHRCTCPRPLPSTSCRWWWCRVLAWALRRTFYLGNIEVPGHYNRGQFTRRKMLKGVRHYQS